MRGATGAGWLMGAIAFVPLAAALAAASRTSAERPSALDRPLVPLTTLTAAMPLAEDSGEAAKIART